jgi:hypothetical protein
MLNYLDTLGEEPFYSIDEMIDIFKNDGKVHESLGMISTFELLERCKKYEIPYKKARRKVIIWDILERSHSNLTRGHFLHELLEVNEYTNDGSSYIVMEFEDEDNKKVILHLDDEKKYHEIFDDYLVATKIINNGTSDFSIEFHCNAFDTFNYTKVITNLDTGFSKKVNKYRISPFNQEGMLWLVSSLEEIDDSFYTVKEQRARYDTYFDSTEDIEL